MAINWLWCVTVLASFNLILAGDETKPAKRACVVGAGYSGLAIARYMQEYGLNFTVFEATRHVGGTWRFDPHIGFDEDGIPLFTSMYKDLRTNTPWQTMEFPGFPIPEDTPAYMSGPCFYKYLLRFAKHFDLMKNIQLRSYVTSVKWAGDSWNVTYMRTDTKTNVTESCDFIAIANGQYTKPLWPKFPGQETFKGKIIHSRDYKEAEPYRGRRLMLVGAGPSGLDMAQLLVNVTSKLVHSHHLVYNQPPYPPHYIKKPDIKAFNETGVIFQDDSFEEVDDVIFCTGYDFSHPFLDDNTGVTHSVKYVLPLYEYVVNIKHPSMVFVGISKKIINRVLSAQAEYTAALAAGKFKLPAQKTMLKTWLDKVHDLQRNGQKILDVNVVGSDMDPYFQRLSEEAGIERGLPVIADIRDFNAENRLQDWAHYREYDYKIVNDTHFVRKHNPRDPLPCPFDDE